MLMNTGIHRKPSNHGHYAVLDSRIRGNDRGYILSQKTP